MATIHRAHDITGLGHGISRGQIVGTTATGVASNFGAIQPWELEKPGHKIGHALQMALPYSLRCHQPQLISKKVQWPATMGDGTSWRPDENLGYIPYGGLMAIPPVDKTSSWPTTGSVGTPTWPAGGGEPLAPNTAIDFMP